MDEDEPCGCEEFEAPGVEPTGSHWFDRRYGVGVSLGYGRWMMILVAILVLGLVAYGGVEMAHSYVSAQQAQAQIEQAKAIEEVARQGQINATGNLFTIMTFMLFLILVMAVALYILYKRSIASNQRSAVSRPRQMSTGADPALMDPNQALGMLVQLMVIEKLQSNNSTKQLTAPKEEQSIEDPLHWLR